MEIISQEFPSCLRIYYNELYDRGMQNMIWVSKYYFLNVLHCTKFDHTNNN